MASLFFSLAVEAKEHIVFIVHPSNGTSRLTRHEIADYFFKRSHRWPDGKKVRFIDQADKSESKRIFLREYLHKTQREVDLFWIGEKNFNGQGAPIQAPNDEMVISAVAELPGAIGYVYADQVDLKRVKPITVTPD